eukprot:714220-Rhodomonas_salina.3
MLPPPHRLSSASGAVPNFSIAARILSDSNNDHMLKLDTYMNPSNFKLIKLNHNEKQRRASSPSSAFRPGNGLGPGFRANGNEFQNSGANANTMSNGYRLQPDVVGSSSGMTVQGAITSVSGPSRPPLARRSSSNDGLSQGVLEKVATRYNANAAAIRVCWLVVLVVEVVVVVIMMIMMIMMLKVMRMRMFIVRIA